MLAEKDEKIMNTIKNEGPAKLPLSDELKKLQVRFCIKTLSLVTKTSLESGDHVKCEFLSDEPDWEVI